MMMSSLLVPAPGAFSFLASPPSGLASGLSDMGDASAASVPGRKSRENRDRTRADGPTVKKTAKAFMTRGQLIDALPTCEAWRTSCVVAYMVVTQTFPNPHATVTEPCDERRAAVTAAGQ